MKDQTPVHASVLLMLLLFALCSCAAHVPVKEVQDAEEALKAAYAAEATVYAPDEYARAQQNFYLSKREINRRSYKKALGLLENAEKEAQLAITKSQAAKTIEMADNQLYGSDLVQLKKYITDVSAIAEKSLEKAESAYKSEKYTRIAKTFGKEDIGREQKIFRGD
jgi:hypothetical protein